MKFSLVQTQEQISLQYITELKQTCNRDTGTAYNYTLLLPHRQCTLWLALGVIKTSPDLIYKCTKLAHRQTAKITKGDIIQQHIDTQSV